MFVVSENAIDLMRICTYPSDKNMLQQFFFIQLSVDSIYHKILFNIRVFFFPVQSR